MAVIRNMAINTTLVASLVAWVLAQALKVVFSFKRQKGFDFRMLVSAGGMPSAHSALVVSLCTMVGLGNGFDSDTFAVAVVVAMVVMYDAAGVRRAAGRQAAVLNEMMKEWHTEKRFSETRLRELIGHTPVEVLVGALIGIVIALLFFSA